MMDTTDWSLLAKYVRGEANPEETQRMEAWLEEDPAHRETLDRAQEAWRASGDVYRAYTTDTASAWQAIDRRTREAPVVALPPRTRRRVWILRAAAVVGLVVGLVFLAQLLNLPGGAGLAKVSTGEQETKQVTLADGTQVWLNENTTLRYDEDLDDSVRTVYLSGEAFFDVARNEDQPFRILSGDALVRVLGTSFNVLALPADTVVVVTVVSGTVALADKDTPSSSLVLQKGEQGIYQTADQRVRPVATVAPNALAWYTRQMTFENQSLSEVSEVLEEVYQRRVALDPTIADLKLTAEFDDQSLEEVLEVIALTLDVNYRAEGNTIYLEEIEK